jgi:Domain of unknown function (DUF4340)
MKKEYLILIVLILLFSAYLFLHKENKDNYTLPEIKKIDTSQVTGLVLEKKDGAITFTKKDKQWLLTEKEYPADQASVDHMLDALKALKLSALVSEKQDLKRYELNDENRIMVKAMKGEETVFEFFVGKPAPTQNHTFVMLQNDKNVYHANGSLKSYFDKTVEAFRDKKVLEFKDASLKKMTIEKDGKSKTLIPKEVTKEENKEGAKDTPKEKAAVIWTSEDGESVDSQVVSNLISMLSFLQCQKYIDSLAREELEKDKPLCKILLENEAALELTLFKSAKEEQVNAISSMNHYAFELSRFNGKEIVSDIDKLLGIQKSEKKKE